MHPPALQKVTCDPGILSSLSSYKDLAQTQKEQILDLQNTVGQLHILVFCLVSLALFIAVMSGACIYWMSEKKIRRTAKYRTDRFMSGLDDVARGVGRHRHWDI